MPRTYNVIDADGHVLEPIDIWDKYIDPAFRDRAPRIVVDTDGKERLDVEGQRLGSQKGFGVIGAIGARQGDVPEETMTYIDGRKGGFDPHARIPDMDLDGIDAAFLYPSGGPGRRIDRTSGEVRLRPGDAVAAADRPVEVRLRFDGRRVEEGGEEPGAGEVRVRLQPGTRLVRVKGDEFDLREVA